MAEMKIAYRDRDAPCGCCRPPSPTCGLRRVLRGCGPWCAAVSTGSRGTPAGVSLSSGRVPAAVSARPPYRFRVRLAGSAAAGVGREAVHVHSEAVPVHVHEDTNGIRNQKTGGDVRETVFVYGYVNVYVNVYVNGGALGRQGDGGTHNRAHTARWLRQVIRRLGLNQRTKSKRLASGSTFGVGGWRETGGRSSRRRSRRDRPTGFAFGSRVRWPLMLGVGERRAGVRPGGGLGETALPASRSARGFGGHWRWPGGRTRSQRSGTRSRSRGYEWNPKPENGGRRP
jgi:hypothetical protein